MVVLQVTYSLRVEMALFLVWSSFQACFTHMYTCSVSYLCFGSVVAAPAAADRDELVHLRAPGGFRVVLVRGRG